MYKKPYNKEEIKKYYPELAGKLLSDPVHLWRAESGIELIHKEPDKKELERIWKNWRKMSLGEKEISDKKSIEIFGMTNEESYKKLKAEKPSEKVSEFDIYAEEAARKKEEFLEENKNIPDLKKRIDHFENQINTMCLFESHPEVLEILNEEKKKILNEYFDHDFSKDNLWF